MIEYVEAFKEKIIKLMPLRIDGEIRFQKV